MSHKVFVETMGVSDWRRQLAKPDLHWKRGRSAFEMAVSWERARSQPDELPPEIAALFQRNSEFSGARLALGVVEHKVDLEGGTRPSQNDLWALVRTDSGLVSVAIEGKAGEEFGPTIQSWKGDAEDGTGKEKRLAFLCKTLALESAPAEARYQLIHRTASAVLEAKRFGLSRAAMIVQSFAEDARSWSDYSRFVQLLGGDPARGMLCKVRACGPVQLHIGWAQCIPATDAQASEAL